MTLLEVVIAVLLSVMMLRMIVSLSSEAHSQAVYSEISTAATGLARFKMNEIEAKLMHDGFQDGEQEESGDFSEQGWPTIRWEAKIQMVAEFGAAELADINNRCLGGVLGEVENAIGAEGQAAQEQASDAVAAAEDAYMQAILQFLPLIKNVFDKSLRKVHLTIFWNNYGEAPRRVDEAEEKFSVELYIFNAAAFEQEIAPFRAGAAALGNQ